VDGDRPAVLQAGHPGADRLDPAGVLVPQRERQLPRHGPGRELVQHVQVGVADARAADPQQHLARAGLRAVHLAQLGVGLPGGDLERAHGISSSVGRVRPQHGPQA
jgi:hypothetical protein